MMTKKTNARVFAVCSLVLFWSFFSVSSARADRNHFRDHDDDVTINEGTVYDEKTSLTWQQNGYNGPFTWQEALAYVESLNTGGGYGGCRGWVLPTSKELDRLVDHNKHSGSSRIDTDYFPNTHGDFYWSSSSHRNTLKYATSFGNGKKRKRSSSNKYYVRARRGDCDPTDNDGDGYTPGGQQADCNDNDPNINPGAVEMCDGLVDNNCDGSYDLSCWDVDNDFDGQTENQGDCDDRDPNNYSGNAEVCDGADNDCDTVADNGLTYDTDGDGYTSIGSCAGSADDCSDNNEDVHPGAAEICGDLVDQDCDGVDLSCLDVDNDGDGLTENAGDCDDTDPNINPAATEICDNLDNNCDGSVDENLTQATSCGVGQCGSTGIETCTAGTWGNNTCTQGAPSAEVCDNVDNNCDGTIDENLTQATSCGVGECGAAGIETCSAGAWGGDTCVAGTPSAETCDNLDNNCDGNIDENLTQATSCGVGACAGNTGEETCTAGAWGGDTCDPFAGATAETCDNLDNNCDGQTDEGVTTTFYYDLDGDTFGTPDVFEDECSASQGFVSNNTDCNDDDVSINPNAVENCDDSIDNNCDTVVNEGCNVAAVQLGSGGYYNLIQDAYVAAGGVEIIKMQSIPFMETLSFDRGVIVTLAGGYDELFSEPSTGWTTIASSGTAMVITNGTVIIEYIILR